VFQGAGASMNNPAGPRRFYTVITGNPVRLTLAGRASTSHPARRSEALHTSGSAPCGSGRELDQPGVAVGGGGPRRVLAGEMRDVAGVSTRPPACACRKRTQEVGARRRPRSCPAPRTRDRQRVERPTGRTWNFIRDQRRGSRGPGGGRVVDLQQVSKAPASRGSCPTTPSRGRRRIRDAA